MRESEVVVFRLCVDQNGVALVERAALGVLSGEAHGIPLKEHRAKSQCFGKAIIDGTLAVAHFCALFEKLRDFRVDVKPLGHANEAVGDLRKFLGSEPGIDLIFRFVAAMLIRRPVVREFAQMRYFPSARALVRSSSEFLPAWSNIS